MAEAPFRVLQSPALVSWLKPATRRRLEAPSLDSYYRTYPSRKNGWSGNPAGKPHECGCGSWSHTHLREEFGCGSLAASLGVSLCGPNSPQRRRGRELHQTRIRPPRPDAVGQPALRHCNLSQLGCIFACRTASLGLLTEPPAQFLEGPYFLASKRLRKLINYMPLSSFSEGRKVPKSLAFIALLGLLLIAAVAFVPNSSAGLPAFH